MEVPSTKGARRKYCDDCRKFVAVKNYRRHRRARHKEERISALPKQCPHCSKMKRSTNLARHLKVCKLRPTEGQQAEKTHQKIRQCDICLKSVSRSHFSRHNKACKKKHMKGGQTYMDFTIKENREIFFEIDETPPQTRRNRPQRS